MIRFGIPIDRSLKVRCEVGLRSPEEVRKEKIVSWTKLRKTMSLKVMSLERGWRGLVVALVTL